MRSKVIILFCVLISLFSCKKWNRQSIDENDLHINIVRYDRLQSRYLTTGDFSALQQMNTGFPMETRILIEDILELGQVNDADINSRFLNFFQDTIAQTIISEAEMQYAKMDDINKDLTIAFHNLKEYFPNIVIPTIYAQISAFRQSIVVSDETIGISIDKYLGEDYSLYKRFYTDEQRKQMNRDNIVPDCLSFYLISLFPLNNFDTCSQQVRDTHIAKIHWIINKVTGKYYYKGKEIEQIERYVNSNNNIPLDKFIQDTLMIFR